MIIDKHKTHYLNIQNIKVPVWVYGDLKNPPIIFIHGFFRGFSEYIGDLPVRYLMKKYCVVAFDLPGFGVSKEIEIDKIEFVSQIQKQILKNKKSVLFGVSYGGLISLEYYSNYRDNVSKIIIAGTPIFSGIFNIYKIFPFLPMYKEKKVPLKVFREFNFLNKLNLSRIKVPVLLYYNKSDYVANIFMGKKLDKMLPNSRLFISKGQNHKWLLHRIDENGFLNEINSFLKNF